MAAPTAEAGVGTGPAAGLRITPRRARAGGRAVAGGFLVALAAVVVFTAWLHTRPGQGRTWVVAAVPLAAGARVSPGDLTTVVLPLHGEVAATAFSSRAEVVGRVLAVPLRAGELVSAPELTPAGAPPTTRPVSLTVPGPDLTGLQPGERVDVLQTTGSSPTTHTVLLLRGAEVMRLASGGGGLLGGSGGGDVVTLGVGTLHEVVAVVAAEHAGIIDVVPAEASDGVGLGTAPPEGTATP